MEENEYINYDYIDGVFDIMSIERENSIDLKKEDAKDKDVVEKLLWDVDLYGQSLDLEPAKIPCFKPDFFNI